jgi:hypothetical protein
MGRDRVVLRNREQAITLIATGFGFCGLLLGWMAFSSERSLREKLLFCVAVVIPYTGFVVLRLARAAVHADDSGITIVNPFKTRQVAWNAIDRFVVDRHGIYPRIGLVELKDGSRIHLWALQGPNPLGRPRNRIAERLIDTLNELLRDSRNSEPA